MPTVATIGVPVLAIAAYEQPQKVASLMAEWLREWEP
jgi:hypothetical protein